MNLKRDDFTSEYGYANYLFWKREYTKIKEREEKEKKELAKVKKKLNIAIFFLVTYVILAAYMILNISNL